MDGLVGGGVEHVWVVRMGGGLEPMWAVWMGGGWFNGWMNGWVGGKNLCGWCGRVVHIKNIQSPYKITSVLGLRSLKLQHIKHM